MILNLQFFAEEGGDSQLATDTGAEVTDAGAAEVTEQATPESVEETKPTFDDLIKGDYKKDYDKAVKSAINKRFRNQANLQKQLDAQAPILEMLSNKYGVAETDKGFDVDAIQRKLDEDNAMYEQEAFDKGIDVDTLKQMKQLERQIAIQQRQLQEAERREGFERLVQQANAAKEIYPDFDLDTEMMDEGFGRLIANGIDAKTAYEVVHMNDIMTSGMQYAVQHTKENISRDIQSGKRPQENGTSSNASSSVGSVDVSKLSLKQIREYAQRAANGEKITFA